jgi:cell division protein FtsZ
VVVLVTAQSDVPLAAVAARLARREHVLVVAIVAGGFASANPALAELGFEADAVIEIPSGVAGADVGLDAAGSSLERIIASAVHGLIAPLTHHGFIGWDLEDLRAVMRRPGRGRVGLGWGHGVRGAEEAARRTIASPALAGSLLKDAAAIFIAFIVGETETLTDINDTATIIQEASHEETNIVFAAVVEPRMVDAMRVVLYAVGQRRGAA